MKCFIINNQYKYKKVFDDGRRTYFCQRQISGIRGLGLVVTPPVLETSPQLSLVICKPHPAMGIL